MQVTLKIFRYNPQKDTRGHYETYTLEADENERVLDLLELVKGHLDGTLSFRRSCAHGICGSDAMRINGQNHLACKTLVRDFGAQITIEPLLGLKIIKDLIVDMEPFFDNYKKVLPYFINDSPLPADGKERLQSPKQRAPIRRDHQMHPVRRLHHLLPVLLGQRRLPGPGGAGHRPPLHLRQPRRGRFGAPQDRQRDQRRGALPHGLQLHDGLPARYPDHQGHRGTENGDHHRQAGLDTRQASRELRPSACSTE